MTLSARVCVVVTSSKQTELDVLCGLFCNAKVGAGLCPRTQKKKKIVHRTSQRALGNVCCGGNASVHNGREATSFGECLICCHFSPPWTTMRLKHKYGVYGGGIVFRLSLICK
jgi:hypothetical protein